MKFITKEGLKQLDFYSYKSGAYTWLDNKLLTHVGNTSLNFCQWLQFELLRQ